MVNKRGRGKASAGARRVMKRISNFYTVLATHISLRRRQNQSTRGRALCYGAIFLSISVQNLRFTLLTHFAARF